jgi:hypothetical protein
VGRVGDFDTISRELGVGIHRVVQGLQLSIPARSRTSVPVRGRDRLVLLALNNDSKKMMERSHVLHREFLAESCDNPLKKTHGGGRQNNIINI